MDNTQKGDEAQSLIEELGVCSAVEGDYGNVEYVNNPIARQV